MLNETLAEKKFLFVFFQRDLNNDVTNLKTRLSPYKILECIFMDFDSSFVLWSLLKEIVWQNKAD